ncbi:unnamed protein product [Diplocarpon coronariae]
MASPILFGGRHVSLTCTGSQSRAGYSQLPEAEDCKGRRKKERKRKKKRRKKRKKEKKKKRKKKGT